MSQPSKQQRKPMAAGVGESRTFNAPEGVFPENPVLDCHVGGVKVRDLPVEVQHKILWEQTDEALAEAEKKPKAVAKVLSDPLDKAIRERRDDLSAGIEPWEARDPLTEVAREHVGPGMRPKFLSPARIQSHGTRGFEVVKGPNGDPVKVGRLILGQMPEEKAQKRNQHFRRLADAAQQSVEEQFRETQERALRGAE